MGLGELLVCIFHIARVSDSSVQFIMMAMRYEDDPHVSYPVQEFISSSVPLISVYAGPLMLSTGVAVATYVRLML